jgi:uncharacterized small protein (DUF1192 family)
MAKAPERAEVDRIAALKAEIEKIKAAMRRNGWTLEE